MNPDYEQKLAARVKRELDTLGELSPSPALTTRILHHVATTSPAPRPQQAWSTWPGALRLASLAMLLTGFAGICVGTWNLTEHLTTLTATTEFSDLQALWRTAAVLGNLLTTFTSRLSPNIIVAGLTLLFTAIALCLGLTSACVRLALRPATNRILP